MQASAGQGGAGEDKISNALDQPRLSTTLHDYCAGAAGMQVLASHTCFTGLRMGERSFASLRAGQ